MSENKKVLVVDDEPTVLELIKTMLENNGFDFLGTDGGAAAIKMAEKEQPGIILLDVMLPDMDGITICRRLRSNPKTKDIPVVMVSSLTDVATVQDAHLFGASGYISKPFDEATLIQKVEKAFMKSPPK